MDTSKESVCKMKTYRTTSQGSRVEVTDAKSHLQRKRKKWGSAELSSLPLVRRGKRKSSSSGDAEYLTPRSEIKKRAQKDNIKKYFRSLRRKQRYRNLLKRKRILKIKNMDCSEKQKGNKKEHKERHKMGEEVIPLRVLSKSEWMD